MKVNTFGNKGARRGTSAQFCQFPLLLAPLVQHDGPHRVNLSQGSQIDIFGYEVEDGCIMCNPNITSFKVMVGGRGVYVPDVWF